MNFNSQIRKIREIKLVVGKYGHFLTRLSKIMEPQIKRKGKEIKMFLNNALILLLMSILQQIHKYF